MKDLNVVPDHKVSLFPFVDIEHSPNLGQSLNDILGRSLSSNDFEDVSFLASKVESLLIVVEINVNHLMHDWLYLNLPSVEVQDVIYVMLIDCYLRTSQLICE